MERHQVIARFWNWLPGFRAVAETEHLPTAAEHAHVTAAALSRTVRLLEHGVGRPLFHRRGRRLHLNDDGRALLEATRMAMRLVHDAASAIGGKTLEGPIRIAAGGVGQVLTLRALLLAHREFPGMLPSLLTPDPSLVADQLLCGDLDLVVGSFNIPPDGLTAELLGYATSSIYCGPGHSLYGCRSIDVEEVSLHPFAAPPNGVDGWPEELPRTIHFTADRMAAGMEVCGSTALLAVIPDAMARTSAISLHRLPLDGLIPKTPVMATLRTPTGADDLVCRVLDSLKTVCETLDTRRG